MTEEVEHFLPKRVFVVPYRNRVQQKFFFEKYMSFILEDRDDYEIFFSHQADTRSFNRGAAKNIGFMAVKEKYPDHYKTMDIVFNDVDTIPFNKIFTYATEPGVVKHYYGFKYTLGGIVVIKGDDFEKINGFPNYWGWGNEDNCLQMRCIRANLKIDRNEFYNIGSPQILQLFDGISRIIGKRDFSKMRQDNGYDGIHTIHQWTHTVDKKSVNPEDNVFIVDNPRIYVVNTTFFLTAYPMEQDEYYQYDLRENTKKIVNPDPHARTNKMFVSPDEWKNIPYYPTLQERKERGPIKKVYPHQHQYLTPKPLPPRDTLNPLPPHHQVPHHQVPPHQVPPHQVPPHQVPPHPYSSEYAKYAGIKPRATKSVNISMGGVRG